MGLRQSEYSWAKEENEIGAPLQGRIAKIAVSEGDKVKTNEVLFVLEAMKMESSVVATESGKVKAVHLAEGSLVEQDDLVVEMEGWPFFNWSNKNWNTLCWWL